MSLRFIMGPSGSGKSHYLYEYVRTESEKCPQKEFVFVVPDQYTMQAKRDYVRQNPRRGMLNVDVLSFNRLAYRIFDEVGQESRLLLDDTGKNFVLKKIAGQRKEDLRVLKGNISKIGYIEEVKSSISEFMQYHIGSGELLSLAQNMGEAQTLTYKLQDLALIYADFEKFLQEKYMTGEELLDRLSGVLGESARIRKTVFIFDGFTGFTPLQRRVVARCMELCEQVLVSVIGEKESRLHVYEHPYQLYALSKQTVTDLLRIAGEKHIEVLPPVTFYQDELPRTRTRSSLRFLQKHLFSYGSDKFEREQDEIFIYEAFSPREEISFVAQEIRRLVRTKGYRYREIAVITSSMEVYAREMEQTFALYEIPIFTDHKRSILLNAFVEYVRSLLEIQEQNFSYESIFRYLRTGLSEFTADEVDRMENYVLARGIRGYKKWNEPWEIQTDQTDETQLAVLEELRSRFMSRRQELFEVLKKRNKTVYEVTAALHAFLLQEKLQKKVREQEIRFEEAGEFVMAKEYAQVYRVMMDLFDKFVELLGTERISIREYCELLDAGLAQAKIGTIPPSLDQVVAGDLERTRIPDVKAVFLIGMNDQYLSGNMSGGLISDRDRELIKEAGGSLAPGAKEKIYIQKFYLHLTMSKPSQMLYLTYSKVETDGKKMRPAYVIDNLLRIFPHLLVCACPQHLSDTELTEKSGMAYLIEDMQTAGGELSGQWKELYNWYRRQPEWNQTLENIMGAVSVSKPDGRLKEAVAGKLYGSLLKNSVTRLEQFAVCAYAHFLNYGLKLSPREEYQFRALDFGNMFHMALELYGKQLSARNLTWTGTEERQREEILEACIGETMDAYQNSIVAEKAREGYVKQRLRRMLKRTVWAMTRQLEKGDFVPKDYERTFGKGDTGEHTLFRLDEEHDMLLRGKIDRIDICEEDKKVYVKVTDYKTGSKSFDISDLYQGLQMQLAAYMLVALDEEQKKHPDKTVIPSGIFYYRIQDPLVAGVPDEKLDQELLKALRPDGMVNQNEENLHHMDRDMTGESEVIPVKRKKDQSLSATSKVVGQEEFQLMLDYTSRKMQETGRQIVSGDIDIAPYKKGQQTGCSYCPYAGVCRFDTHLPGYEYREHAQEDRETVMEKIKEDAKTWE